MSFPADAGFDAATVADLIDLLGAEGVAQLMTAFAAELSLRPALVLAELDAGRPEQARFAAHYLKGAALSLGATAVAAAAGAVEDAPTGTLRDHAVSLRRLADQVSPAV